MFPALALLVRPCTSLMLTCAVLICRRMDCAIMGKFKGGLSKYSFIKGVYVGRIITLLLPIMKRCEVWRVLS